MMKKSGSIIMDVVIFGLGANNEELVPIGIPICHHGLPNYLNNKDLAAA